MNSQAELVCGSMRIVFARDGDRIAHRVDVLDRREFVPVLASLEGRPHDIWPSSPALQTVHLETRPGGEVALLVGMAGTSHFSASIETDRAAGQVAFDIACRTASQPHWLGTTYRWMPARPAAARLRPITIDGLPAAPPQIDRSSEELILRPALGSGPLPRTIRWSYRIALA